VPVSDRGVIPPETCAPVAAAVEAVSGGRVAAAYPHIPAPTTVAPSIIRSDRDAIGPRPRRPNSRLLAASPAEPRSTAGCSSFDIAKPPRPLTTRHGRGRKGPRSLPRRPSTRHAPPNAARYADAMLCRHSVVTILAALSALAAGLSSGVQPTTPSPAADVQPSTKNAATEPIPRTDEWWTKRNETFSARARQGAEKGDIGVVFLGDSITQGWEQNGQQVWKDRYTSRNAVNFGIGGDRTQHLLWRIKNGNLDALSSPKAGAAPKLAIILIGTNNCNGTDHTAAEVAQGVSAIVAAVREKLPATKVLLMGIFPRGERPSPIREKIAEINTKIAALHDGSAVFYKDISSVFLDDQGVISKEIMPDALHLSARGYQLWADAIEPDVRDLLGGS